MPADSYSSREPKPKCCRTKLATTAFMLTNSSSTALGESHLETRSGRGHSARHTHGVVDDRIAPTMGQQVAHVKPESALNRYIQLTAHWVCKGVDFVKNMLYIASSRRAPCAALATNTTVSFMMLMQPLAGRGHRRRGTHRHKL
jgi:hypothetical protein